MKPRRAVRTAIQRSFVSVRNCCGRGVRRWPEAQDRVGEIRISKLDFQDQNTISQSRSSLLKIPTSRWLFQPWISCPRPPGMQSVCVVLRPFRRIARTGLNFSTRPTERRNSSTGKPPPGSPSPKPSEIERCRTLRQIASKAQDVRGLTIFTLGWRAVVMPVSLLPPSGGRMPSEPTRRSVGTGRFA